MVKGKVAKVMPFGVFVELDKDIQGLAHIMELSHESVKNPEEFLKAGEEKDFKIISIEPSEHRLGLSLKALTEAPKKEAKTEEPVKEKEEPAKTEDQTKAEVVSVPAEVPGENLAKPEETSDAKAE